VGSFVGIVPQCGFSAFASSLYSGKIISIGTVIAVFLSTSDEMLPVLISNSVPLKNIFIILGTKFVIALIVGFVIDAFFKQKIQAEEHNHEIEKLCDHEHCQCQKGIFRSSLYHSLHVYLFIFIVSLALNTVIHYIGEDKISSLIIAKPIIGQVVSSFIGLIPNCASSVLITELYIQEAITAGSMMSGLLVGAGVGLLALFRANKHIKENLFIVAVLYISGVVFGILLDIIGFGAFLI
jgi:hypothetical protein